MITMNHTTALIILTPCVIGISSYCLFWIYRKRAENRYQRCARSYKQIPRTWKQVGRVTGITIYPLKSGYPLSVERAFCDVKGARSVDGYPLSDRSFVVFDRHRGKYISNQVYHQLIRVKVDGLNEELIQFSVHNEESTVPLTLNMKDLNDRSRPRRVHTILMYEKDTVRAVDCGDAASKWFSTLLTGSHDVNIRLGYDCDEQRRLNGTVYEKYRSFYGSHISNDDMGKFSYFASYMVMNEASVNDLNERLTAKGEQEVSIQNFRGNIVLRTNSCYEEDDCSWLRINQDVILRTMKPCTRCKMTCLDPDTGEIHPRLEPLRTLRSYRGLDSQEARLLEKNSPRLGLYCGLYSRGTVQVGDPVYVGTSTEG